MTSLRILVIHIPHHSFPSYQTILLINYHHPISNLSIYFSTILIPITITITITIPITITITITTKMIATIITIIFAAFMIISRYFSA